MPDHARGPVFLSALEISFPPEAVKLNDQFRIDKNQAVTMTDSVKKRDFSKTNNQTNRAFISAAEQAEQPIRVGFILLEHFSMVAFTGAVDTLVTANLVQASPIFEHVTLGIDSRKVVSDLGIDISTNATVESLVIQHRGDIDILVVCGGFRCSLESNPRLTGCLKAAANMGLIVGGLWNGAAALAHAGLLDHQECAAHPDNHAFLRENFPLVKVSDKTMVIGDKRATCAGPVSALEMMLKLIGQLKGNDIVRAIREILSCDQVAENQDSVPLQLGDNPTLPETLLSIMELMRNNIEEPLSLEELATCTGISRRQMERLFQSHLEASPSRYYLELRITHARRLLLQSNESITNIALASGFVSSSHFSNCFKDYFGLSPSAARQQRKQA